MNTSERVEFANTAIIVIEFQRTWTERSFFHKLIQREYELRQVYNNTLNLLEVSRRGGLTIIQSPFVLDKTDRAAYKKNPFTPKLFCQFTANTWRSEYTEGIFLKSDIEVQGRTGFDACVGSNLQKILKENVINKVYFLGFRTDHCVSKTMDTLINDGYECILVSDCTATKDSKAQEKIENKFNSIKSRQLIGQIENYLSVVST